MKKPTLRFKAFDREWNECVLKERASFSKGFGYSKNDLIDAGHPIVLYGRLYTKYQTVISDIDTFVDVKEGSVLSQGNEVVIPASGECAEDIARASVIADKNIILGGDLNIIKPDNSLDSVFLALSISHGSAHSKLVSQSQGATIAHLHNAEIQNVVVSYPSDKAEQKAIGSFFTELDSLIEGKRVKLDKLKKLKLAYLGKMFPKKGSRIPEVRFKGFSGDWVEKRLGDVVAVNSGCDYKHLQSGNIPVYGTGGYMLSVNESLSKVDAVGIGRKGTINKPQLLRAPFWTVDTLFFLTVKDNLNLVFFYALAQCIQWERYDESTGLPSLSKNNIVNIDILLPSPSEQQKIGAFFQNLDNLINLQQKELDKLTNIKSACLSKMFA